jgi:hypothetical protein
MILEKALIALLNQEKDKADTLFHDFILERSRQIHESLRQGEDFILDESMEGIMSIDEMFGDDDMQEDEEVMEFAPGEEEPAVDADAPEAGDELTADDVSGDDELEGDDEEEEEAPIEDRVTDLEADMQRLAAEFDALMGGDDEMVGDEEQVEEAQISISTTADGEINVMASTDDDSIDDGMAIADAPMDDSMPVADDGMGDDFDDEFNDLSESIVDELERINMPTGDGREQGNGKFKQNTVSPALNTPAEKRLAGSPVKIKSSEHSGYDRETAPTPKKIAQRSNVKANATAGQTAVKKEGDSAAILNKLSADPAGQKSLLGSKK